MKIIEDYNSETVNLITQRILKYRVESWDKNISEIHKFSMIF